MSLGQQRHINRSSADWPHIQQCLLNSVPPYISTLPWIVFRCQLCLCLTPVLLPLAGKSVSTVFFDNVWTSNTMPSTAGFTVIHPLWISTNNWISKTTHGIPFLFLYDTHSYIINLKKLSYTKMNLITTKKKFSTFWHNVVIQNFHQRKNSVFIFFQYFFFIIQFFFYNSVD